MPAVQNENKRRSMTQVIAQWWQNWTSTPSPLADPNCCLTGEVERLAMDIGVPPGEIRDLAARGPEAATLLLRRMTALGLDRKKVVQAEPQTFQDLQRVCTLCESRRQCSFDLTLDLRDANWENYCPNVATLKMLNAASRSGPR